MRYLIKILKLLDDWRVTDSSKDSVVNSRRNTVLLA